MNNNSMEGEFELVTNEKFSEYLMALGLPREQAQVVDSLKPKLILKINEKEVSITTILDSYTTTSILRLNEEVDEKLAALMVVKSYTVMGEDEFIINSKGPDGQTGKRHFDFFEDGMIMISKKMGFSETWLEKDIEKIAVKYCGNLRLV